MEDVLLERVKWYVGSLLDLFKHEDVEVEPSRGGDTSASGKLTHCGRRSSGGVASDALPLYPATSLCNEITLHVESVLFLLFVIASPS